MSKSTCALLMNNGLSGMSLIVRLRMILIDSLIAVVRFCGMVWSLVVQDEFIDYSSLSLLSTSRSNFANWYEYDYESLIDTTFV